MCGRYTEWHKLNAKENKKKQQKNEFVLNMNKTIYSKIIQDKVKQKIE